VLQAVRVRRVDLPVAFIRATRRELIAETAAIAGPTMMVSGTVVGVTVPVLPGAVTAVRAEMARAVPRAGVVIPVQPLRWKSSSAAAAVVGLRRRELSEAAAEPAVPFRSLRTGQFSFPEPDVWKQTVAKP
jgi:hypothetical protein